MKKAPKPKNKGGAPKDDAEKRKQNDAASAKKKQQDTKQLQEKETQQKKEKESSQLGQQQQDQDKPKTNEPLQAQDKDKKQEKGSGEKNLLGMEGSNVKTKDEHDKDKMSAMKEGDTSGGMQQAIVKGNMQSRFKGVDDVMDGRPIEAARSTGKVPVLEKFTDAPLKQVEDNTTKGESLGNMMHGGKKNTDGKNAPRSNPTLSGENMGKTMQGQAPTAGSAGNVSRGAGVGGEGEHQKEAKEQQKASKPDGGAEAKESKDDPIGDMRKQNQDRQANNRVTGAAMMGGASGGGEGAAVGAVSGMATNSLLSSNKDKDAEKKKKENGAEQDNKQEAGNGGPAKNKAMEQPKQAEGQGQHQQQAQKQQQGSSMALKPSQGKAKSG